MKLQKLFALLLAAVLLLSLCACGKKNDPSVTTVPTTEPAGTTVSTETTAPPVTTEPTYVHMPLTMEIVAEMLEDITAMMERSEIVTIPKLPILCESNAYTGLTATDACYVGPETIEYYISEDPEIFAKQKYMIFLHQILQKHPDCYTISESYVYSKIIDIDFFCEYELLGCKTIEDYQKLVYAPYDEQPTNFNYPGKTTVQLTVTHGALTVRLTKSVDGPSEGRQKAWFAYSSWKFTPLD